MPKGCRKRLVAGAGIVAVALGVSSVAYACTVYRGKLVVVGSNGSTSTAVGNNSNMSYCSLQGGARSPATNGRFDVYVDPASTCLKNGSNKLPARTDYVIRWMYKGFTYNSTGYTRVGDCMPGGSGTTIKTGAQVDGNGYSPVYGFSWSSVTPNNAGEARGVCFGDPFSNYGNQAPLITFAV